MGASEDRAGATSYLESGLELKMSVVQKSASAVDVGLQFTRVARHYNLLMRAVPYEAWADYVEQIVSREGVEVGLALDLACGTGSVGLALGRRGYCTVGADLSEPMVRQAAGREREAGAHFPVAVCDARRLCFRSAFDLVVCLYDSLNYIVDDGGLERVFTGVAASLRPRGLFVFDLNTIRALELNLFTQQNLSPRSLLKYRWTSSYDDGTRLCTIEMRFWYESDGQREEFTEVHYQRAYTTDEVREWLRRAGLELTRTYDGYTFRRPSRWTNRIFCVARKRRGAL